MVISDYSFLLRFLPVFLLIYYVIIPKFRKAVLILFSLFFYAFGEGFYVLILLASCIINYIYIFIYNKSPENDKVKKPSLLLWVFIIFNLSLLIIFKYIPFIPHQPLGISFFTFRTIGALIDTHRGNIKNQDKFVDFAAYICAFPLISMGPITSYKNTDFRLASLELKLNNIEEGLKLLILGLSAKLLLADRIGILYTDVRTIGLSSVSVLLAWLCAFAYSFQLYFDFAGYSLMAAGLMRMIGVEIPDNFNLPYASRSVSDFWRRWHISLGNWFKEYVYIPLGGSKSGSIAKTYFNLFIVWILTSVWHGLGLNYMLWGFFILMFLFIEKAGFIKILDKFPLIGHLYMIVLIPLSWAFFSVTDNAELFNYILKLLPFIAYIVPSSFYNANMTEATDLIGAGNFIKDYYYLFICCILFSTPLFKGIYKKHRDNPVFIPIFIILAVITLYRIAISASNPFMYFDF